MSIERTCDECKYWDASTEEPPCVDCDGPNCRFKPKEENMGEKTYTMTFTAEKINEEVLHDITGNTTPGYKEQLEAAREEIEELKGKTRSQGVTIVRLNGMIDGLKFALRCNGVSGGEV